MNSYWREASTLILTALKKTTNKVNKNYTVLTVKRSSKSSFMPNGIVFPGGNTHLIDSNDEWLNVFPGSILKYYNVVELKETPPILGNNNLQKIPKLLSFKITAVRETFEEVGILLCSKKKGSGNGACYGEYLGLQEWRKIVQSDPTKFLELCQNYNCYPDVQNIHLWSNWLTPTSMGKKRFDTIFFISFVDDIPFAAADNTEIENLSWVEPDQLLKFYKNKELWLPPPQFYELSRLTQFNNITKLKEFASKRSIEGCQRWMPQQVKTSDGLVSLLPGDEAYSAVDFCTATEPQKFQKTAEEIRTHNNVLHRMEFLESSAGTIILHNYEPTNGHVLPAV